MNPSSVGKTIDSYLQCKKDAIHVPTFGIFAGEELKPSQRITVKYDNKAYADENGFAIVDPFIEGVVAKGVGFNAWLRPGETLDLRHEWSHSKVDKISHYEPEDAYDECRGCY
jgi:hypothetical protein